MKGLPMKILFTRERSSPLKLIISKSAFICILFDSGKTFSLKDSESPVASFCWAIINWEVYTSVSGQENRSQFRYLKQQEFNTGNWSQNYWNALILREDRTQELWCLSELVRPCLHIRMPGADCSIEKSWRASSTYTQILKLTQVGVMPMF